MYRRFIAIFIHTLLRVWRAKKTAKPQQWNYSFNKLQSKISLKIYGKHATNSTLEQLKKHITLKSILTTTNAKYETQH